MPDLGAFSSLDTVQGAVQNPYTLNRYLYALANPATFIDPDGHCTYAVYGNGDYVPVCMPGSEDGENSSGEGSTGGSSTGSASTGSGSSGKPAAPSPDVAAACANGWLSGDACAGAPSMPQYSRPPGAMSFDDAQALVDAMLAPMPFASDDFLEWRDVSSWCWARAHIMARRISELMPGATIGKVWAGDETAWEDASGHPENRGPTRELAHTDANGRTYRWDWHVAVTVKVETPSGKTVTMVIDPALSDRPLTVDEWGAELNEQGGLAKPPIETAIGGSNPFTNTGTGYTNGPDPIDPFSPDRGLDSFAHTDMVKAQDAADKYVDQGLGRGRRR